MSKTWRIAEIVRVIGLLVIEICLLILLCTFLYVVVKSGVLG